MFYIFRLIVAVTKIIIIEVKTWSKKYLIMHQMYRCELQDGLQHVHNDT